MSRIWFTADTHFGHRKIIEYCKRPFASVAGMDAALVTNWNTTVSPEDTVYHLGDFALSGREDTGMYWRQLAGKKVLVRGNHDRSKGPWKDSHASLMSTEVGLLMYPNGMSTQFIMRHRPDAAVQSKVVLHGHVHESYRSVVRQDTVYVNVGVDVWGFKPVSFSEVEALVAASMSGAAL